MPYVSILTDPTTGGVAASVGLLGDVNLAEPRALIGFAGPRVVAQAHGEEMPEDFQRSEFGMQQVALVRDMHDWRANFGFTQAPNGAFTFTFFVALKSEPDIKFDYNRATYGSQSGLIPR